MEQKLIVRRATEEDLAKLSFLLQEAGIDSAGVENWIESFILVETIEDSGTEIAATAGLEKYESIGLLRSLVFRKKTLSVENGLNLLQILFEHAKETGIRELFLLTESPSLFIHMNFNSVHKEQMPEALLSSNHFRQNVQKAVLMRKILN